MPSAYRFLRPLNGTAPPNGSGGKPRPGVRVLRRFVLAMIAALLLACPGLAAPQAWEEGFEGKALGPRWTWRTPVPGPRWSLTDRPGWLRITLPQREGGYNHWSEPAPVDEAPQLRAPAPPGDWQVDARIELQAPDPAAHFHAGLMVGIGDAHLLAWGALQGPGLPAGPRAPEAWLEPTGVSGFARAPGEARDLVLRLSKSGDTYRARLRRGTGAWEECGACTLPGAPRFLGILGKSFSPGPGVTFDVDYVRVLPAEPAPARPSERTGTHDWPHFLGPNRDGTSPMTGIRKDWSARPPRVLWQVPLSDHGCAGPSVAAGKVTIIDHEGDRDVVRALDLETGRDLWRFPYREPGRADYGWARATPAVAGGRVYTLSFTGHLHCLDAATGTRIWSRRLLEEFRGRLPRHHFSMSPLVDAGRVIVCPGGPNAAVAALDAATGRTLWQGGGSDAPGYATPVPAVIEGIPQYVVFTSARLIGVDAASGRLLWGTPWPSEFGINAPCPTVLGSSIFITSGYGQGCGLIDVAGGTARPRWRSKELECHFTTPIHLGGAVYGPDFPWQSRRPGRLTCMEPLTGKVHWRQPGFENGGLAAVDGCLIAFDGKNGDVVLIDPSPAAYRELGRFRPLGGQTWAAPVLADGRLLIRNLKALACVDLR